MAICIAGMHRSGTSMVARLLNLCSVYLGSANEILGPRLDNEAGFWENSQFLRLNEEVLAQLGSGWDLPPNVTEGWESREEIIPLRNKAAELVRQFSPHELWGWKDPRNSLMLPFWKGLIPDLKILICLRNPLEVARSLQNRSHSSLAFGLNLWLSYNQRLLYSTQPSERVVTHYNAYFHNPQAELRRVLSLLKIQPSSESIDRACSTISKRLRHSWVTTQELRETKVLGEVLECYLEMCGEAGAIYDASAEKVKLLAQSRNGNERFRLHLRYLKSLVVGPRSQKEA
jgi:hypothetical protein